MIHCHILNHADGGMMMVVEIVEEGKAIVWIYVNYIYGNTISWIDTMTTIYWISDFFSLILKNRRFYCDIKVNGFSTNRSK